MEATSNIQGASGTKFDPRSLFFATELSPPLRVTDFCFRLFIGCMFFWAGSSKLLDLAKFQQDILNYQIVPYVVAAASAVYLPWVEMVCAAGLVFRKFYVGALAILSGLMVVFFIGYVQAISRGINIDCGCFGKISEGSPPWVIITRDIIFLGSFALLWFLESKKNRAAN